MRKESYYGHLRDYEEMKKSPLTREEILLILEQRHTQLIIDISQAKEPEEQEVIEAHCNEVEWLIALIKGYGKSEVITNIINDYFNGLL